MDLFRDIITAVQTDLTIGDESSFTDRDTVKLIINRVYVNKVVPAFRWPQTEDAKNTSSILGQEWYDYPEKFRMNSIWKLSVDGVDYGSSISFKDYMFEKENNFPSGKKKMWANHGNKYFIYPTPVADGVDNIAVWGLQSVEFMTQDTDTTIFSYTMPEVNEAIVLESEYLLKLKGEDIATTSVLRVGELRSLEAQRIIVTAWTKIQEDKDKEMKTQPFFDVPDFFSTRFSRKDTNIGKF